MDILDRVGEQISLIENETNNSIKKIKNIQNNLKCRIKKARELYSKRNLMNLPNLVDILSEAKTLIEKIDDIIIENFEEDYG